MRRRHDGRRAERRGGFTLIEIMLVVVIIGILAGIAAVKFGGRVAQSQEAAARATIQNVSAALALFEVDNGFYPADLNALMTAPANAPTWRGPYLEKAPLDPWGRRLVYVYPSARGANVFDLRSLGADGVESADDLTNWDSGG